MLFVFKLCGRDDAIAQQLVKEHMQKLDATWYLFRRFLGDIDGHES